MADGNGSIPCGAPALLLAETVCARLCDTLDALTAGSLQPDARLRLMRAAWAGLAGPLDTDALIALASGLPDGVRLQADGLDAAASFPPPAGRLLLNGVLLAADALPGGGGVVVSGATNSVVLLPEGPGAAWPPGLAACLAGAAAAAPGQVQAWLVALLAEACGARASLLLGRADAGPPPLLLTF